MVSLFEQAAALRARIGAAACAHRGRLPDYPTPHPALKFGAMYREIARARSSLSESRQTPLLLH